MASHKTSKAPTAKVAPLVIPVPRPRNRLAADPLLKKSGAHTDKRNKRAHAAAHESAQDIVDALSRRKADE
jgi:hypothetical protein